MKSRLLRSMLLFAAVVACGSANAATCAEGTVGGACVDGNLAKSARQGAVFRTEERISVSSSNRPLSQDRAYSYPRNLAGSLSYNSERRESGAIGPRQFSVPYILYGIPN